MNIVLATRNRKKIEEIKNILGRTGRALRIFTLDDFPGCREVEEDGESFEANAVKKAVYISECTGMTAIADDSGLEAEALKWAPGILSARYAGESADDRANFEKLLNEMREVPGKNRNARFVCCIAMAFPDGNVKTFSGYVNGRIGTEPKGKNGFGYDPVFYPGNSSRTFAEMNDNEKNSLSHRGMALRELQEYLKQRRLMG